MDQKKIGLFLRGLRKDKGITQEQLAEQLNVSSKSVSRWETGANMPDLDIIIALAEYYDVDVGELLAGERKTEKVKEEKAVLHEVAEYSKLRETNYLGRIFSVVILGIIAIGILLFANLKLLNNVTGSSIIILITLFFYTIFTIIMFANKNSRSAAGYFTIIRNGLVAVIFSNIVLLALFFCSGDYQNYGIMGAYIVLGIFIITFIVTSIITFKMLKKGKK